MSHVIVDRRLNDKGKSLVNRRKFIDRVRDTLKDSVKEHIRNADIKDLTGPGKKKVRIPVKNLDEPDFRHDGSGINDIVRPGNDRFIPGDKIPRPEGGQGGGGSKGSEDGEGEDTFVFHLTKEEFLDLFFENCALPNMIKKNLSIVNEEELRRTGLTSDGAPSALNIERSMRRAKSRKFALRALKRRELLALEEELKQVEQEITMRKAQGTDSTELEDRKKSILEEMETLKRRIDAIPFVDPMDLRYNHWSKVSLPNVQAVVFHVMDVSGSMTEHMKEMAKTFFILLRLFLEQHYNHIDLVFVKYHSDAKETDEHDFFYGTETGGTVTSKALKLTTEIIENRYPTSLWNIYIAHASDGDNFSYDNPEVEKYLQQLLSIVQYYAYVQINNEMTAQWRASAGDPDSLWGPFMKMKASHSNLDCALVEEAEDVYPVFMKLFEKKPT